jgi:hypothetical protein
VRSEKFVQTLETKVAVTSADVSHDGSFIVFFFGVFAFDRPICYFLLQDFGAFFFCFSPLTAFCGSLCFSVSFYF